jgi:hypothetical protein
MSADSTQPRLVSEGLAGYISMDVPAPPEEYGYGVSLYSSAWPLLESPLRDFQIGLASIWIVPENRKINEPLLPTGTFARDHWPERGPSYRDVFQTIEGGLGFWGSTRFGSTTAKFRMNGTANGYNHEISSPGWGFGNINALRPEQMGIAQLSPRLLVPPDGLTFQEGTCGEVFGYAWMVLPLTAPKTTTAGLAVPTGNQSWTLFINAKNFKGPVAFYTPATWSRVSRQHPPAVGRGLDARPGLVTGGAIEVNTVPRFVSKDADGTNYSRIPRLQFPADEQGRTILIHNLTHYSKKALYSQVESWLAGQEAASGKFDVNGGVAVWALQWPIWIGLLKKQQWAWWILTAVFVLMIPSGLWGIWRIVTDSPHAIRYLQVVPGWLMRPSATVHSHLWDYLTIALLEFITSAVLPLWILLTDKPSAWRRAAQQPVPCL